uniref:Meteorin-like protein n=1 Tax=Daphnia galeata TaxID=27404 RepID=A0A8J2WPZ7_9CRUS|nr:unnamed protein product [Daphnia galeata]
MSTNERRKRRRDEREKRSSPRFSRWWISRNKSLRAEMWWPLIVCLIVPTLLCPSLAASAADGCDWIGSGLESLNPSSEDEHQPQQQTQSHRGVKPVYLRCSQGSVSWLYPRGALRVVLRYGTAGKEFQGCLKLSSDFGGANIYVEQHRTLKLLHSGSTLLRPDGKRHCFDSHKGQVALFLESDSIGGGSDPLRRETAAFDYDLQLVEEEDDQSHDPWQECRPCSVKESLEMFCSSDFVARGFISSVSNDAQLERTLLKVRATRVIRQASTVFEPVGRPPSLTTPNKRKRRSSLKRLIAIPSKWKGMDGVEEDLTDNNEMESNSLIETTEEEHTGTLHVPLTCQVKHGSGEFIFMGRKRLGDAVLWCAPRLEEWQQWIHQAQTDGSAQCRLEA